MQDVHTYVIPTARQALTKSAKTSGSKKSWVMMKFAGLGGGRGG